MVLVPLLTARCGLDQRRAFATSVAIILPLCVLSSVIYLFRGGLDLAVALPYLAGGQGRGGGGEKIEQVDPLCQVLLHTGEGGHIDQQQCAAAHAEAGEHAGHGSGQGGHQPAHRPKSDLKPP